MQQGDLESMLGVISTAGYAPHRFGSQSEPRTLLVDKFGAVVLCCIKCWASSQSNDHEWGKTILQALSGPRGFKDCVIFAIDTDFVCVATALLRLKDKSKHSAIVSRREARESLLQLEALFKNLGIFRRDAEGLYTQTMLRRLETVREIPEGGTIGWKFKPA